MSQSTKPTVKRVRKPAAGSKKAMAAAAAAAAATETVVEGTEPMKVSEEIPSDIKKVLDTVTENLTDDEVLAHLGNYIEEPFTVLESYFHGQHLERLVRHQIESYNHFINYQMQKTIQMFNPVMIRSENDYVEKYDKYLLEISISFQNFKLFSPQIYENNGATKVMFPQEAKLRNFTYASTMTVDVKIDYIIRNTECMDNPRIVTKVLPKINIGKMPIMLKSSICVLTQNKAIDPVYMGECPMDCGGYFIIKGSEKTVLGQERAAENRVYCFDGKNTTKWSWYAEIKSIPDFKCISPKQIEMMIASKNNGFGHGIFMNIPRIKQPIELFVVFRALGITTDRAICEYVTLGLPPASSEQRKILEFLQASVIDANKYMTQEDALRHIAASVAYTPMNMDKEKGAKKKLDFTNDVLHNDMFPHCKTPVQKLYMIGYMCQKLIQTCLGWRAPDDRDSYVNKRIELTGTLLNNLFRNYFNKLVKEMQKQVVREINNGSWRSTDNFENIINMTNIYKIMKSTTIENGINRALATGDFSIKQSNSSKVGVAQVLNRLTYLASLSHSRRINTPLEKSGELIAPRKLHNTTWGFLCCLTGDTEVLLSNRIGMKKIKDICDGDWVNTVNRTTLCDEPSFMYNFFSKMPDKLYKITTISGRTVKATDDHPFLVNQGNQNYTMVKLSDLQPGDKLVIRHMVNMIADENTTQVVIYEKDVSEQYRMELLELNFLNHPIPLYKLKIIARLIGALNTDGNIGMSKDVHGDMKYYRSSFCVGEEYDAFQLVDDIRTLGFGMARVKRETSSFEDKVSGRMTHTKTWKVCKDGSFSYLMCLLGGFCGKKTTMKRQLPEWLINAELSIKREFLSGFQGGDGCRISCQKNQNMGNWKIHMGYTSQTTHDDYLNETTQYMQQIVNMFHEFNIKCCVKTNKIKDEPKSKVSIVFDTGAENLTRYTEIINYTYCEDKRRASALAIEHLKIRAFNKEQRNQQYAYILKNYGKQPMEQLVANTGISSNQIQKIVSKNKKGHCPKPRYTSEVSYEQIVRDNVCDNGCVSVPILSIEEIEPELVYDFTVSSDNHSFVASSFVVSNCAETPEGQSIGVVKNISYMAHITIPTNSVPLYDYILPKIQRLEDLAHPSEAAGKVRVFINGAWVGVTEQPQELYEEIKDKKFKGIINIYTSVVFDCKNLEIRVCNDGGRLTRPLLKVRNQRALLTADIVQKLRKHELTWNDLLVSCRVPESVIEYIDPEEQNFAMIAMKTRQGYIMSKGSQGENTMVPKCSYKYTHCEIHPSTVFGVLASCIPFPDHNQSPRNTYQCCMGKQALGVYALNYDQRMDKTAYVLAYPSRPLVDTRVMNFLKINRIPSGHQITVAIMAYTAYNQEDSLLINKGSIDRGLFMTTVYHTEKDEDKNIIRDEIIRCKPDPNKTRGIKYGNYDKLNTQGFIAENTLVENRDVIIAKTVPIKENRNDPTKTIKYEDQSKTFRTTEECYVDKNYTGRNGDGYNFAKVRIRTLRKPVLGDKFSSRAGQKGTCGLIIPEQDMPYTKNGLRPDIILNPHAIPSRMTIGQLKETVLGKVLLELGMFGDGTSFGELDVPTICRELQKLGYESYGNEVMYNGYTGEQLETSIFIGPVYYQRLKHMVNDKQHSRSIGPMVNLTRQPAEGRSRDGGFRIGEMERDVMIAHGISRFCRERLYDVSDKYTTHVCGKCGMIACYNEPSMKQTQFAKSDMSIHLCRTCNNTTDFAKVEIPYAYKLLAQELQTINIVPRILTE